MSNNEKYTIKELSFDEMLNDLSNTSPLMMSKKLIEYELYDQQDSLDILNSIFQEYESRDNIIDNLVNPMLLSLADGLVKHPKLGLEKTGIKTERLLNEIKNNLCCAIHEHILTDYLLESYYFLWYLEPLLRFYIYLV